MHFRSYLAETLGTFSLVFCGTGAIVINQESGGLITHVGVAITFGLIVSAMIFSLGDVSGAHFNPVVSLAFVVAKRFPLRAFFPYILFQGLGAFAASGLIFLMFPNNKNLGVTLPAGSEVQAFIMELVLTFILVLVILNVSTGAKEKGITAAIAIGAVVGLEAVFAGPISGASMNPVRSLAPAVVSGQTDHLWLYFAAPITGSLIGVFMHQLLYKKET